MSHIDPFGADYLRLVLEIHTHHIDGYVDAYYGPAEIKAKVESAAPKTPAELLAAARDLQSRIPTADVARHAYLTATLRGIECTVRMLNGETVPYLDEVYALYDVRPQRVDEARFEAAHRALDRLLPGANGEALGARLQRWRQSFEVDAGRAMPLLDLARAETRRRTTAFVDLPDDESVEVTLVQGQPWSAYNWYLGHGRSLIEFNTDVPLQAPSLIGTFAHEGYPGHHTEALLTEQTLYHERGYAEQAAMLLHSPAAVIAEGIATTALEMIFPDGDRLGDQHEWNVEVMFPAAGIPTRPGLADELRAISAASDALRYVSGNAAILYNTGELSREQTIDYIRAYGLATADRAAKSFSFISHPLYRSYPFTYTAGYDLINGTADPAATFRRLLTSQHLPSQLNSGSNG